MAKVGLALSLLFVLAGCGSGLMNSIRGPSPSDAKVQAEQEKDRELEAQFERRRNLESGLEDAVLARKKLLSALTSSQPKTTEIRDVNGDGVPDLWIYYNPLRPGEIVRQEEDTNGDGKVDTWSRFEDGKLARREVDTKRTGKADTVYYYEKEQVVREERDEHGAGHVSFRAIYQNGRLAGLEKDTQGKGKIDLWVYYDATKEGEAVLKEERDLNGDGVVDMWSYYEDGRLARRDLTAVGLELLFKQDQIPSSPPDSKKISIPRSR